MPKFLGSRPDIAKDCKEVMPDIRSIVQYVNSLSSDAKDHCLKRLIREKRRRRNLSCVQSPHFLPLKGQCRARSSPDFRRSLTDTRISAMQRRSIIDEEYARMYGGKLILRFDDTNPLKEELEYYEAIQEGLDWLGVKAGHYEEHLRRHRAIAKLRQRNW